MSQATTTNNTNSKGKDMFLSTAIYFSIFFGLIFLAIMGLEILATMIVTALGGGIIATIFSMFVYGVGFFTSIGISAKVAKYTTDTINRFVAWICS